MSELQSSLEHFLLLILVLDVAERLRMRRPIGHHYAYHDDANGRERGTGCRDIAPNWFYYFSSALTILIKFTMTDKTYTQLLAPHINTNIWHHT